MSAQTIVIGIMADPLNRPHWRLSRAAVRRPSATFELRVRKVFLVRVVAIRERAYARKAEVRAGLAELSILVRARLAISCGAQ